MDIEVDNLKLGLSAALVLGGSFVREVNNGQGGSMVPADPDGDGHCPMLP